MAPVCIQRFYGVPRWGPALSYACEVRIAPGVACGLSQGCEAEGITSYRMCVCVYLRPLIFETLKRHFLYSFAKVPNCRILKGYKCYIYFINKKGGMHPMQSLPRGPVLKAWHFVLSAIKTHRRHRKHCLQDSVPF